MYLGCTKDGVSKNKYNLTCIVSDIYLLNFIHIAIEDKDCNNFEKKKLKI